MPERIMYNDRGEPVGRTPIYELEAEIGAITLDYTNCTIRRFGPGFEDFVHIEYVAEGQIKGLAVGQDVLEELEDLNFPARFDPYPSDIDSNWFTRRQMSSFDDEAARYLEWQ